MPPGFDSPSLPIWPAFLLNVGLRDYQHLMLLQAARLMRQGFKRILLVAPTGAGKTVMAAEQMGSAATHAQTSEIIVHRKELIKQTSSSFSERGLTHGFIAAKMPFDPDTGITLAGVQTLVNRLAGLLPPNTAIVDEAHHASSDTWSRVLEYYGDAYIIGFTATPQRLDGTGLDKQFDVMIQGPSVAELIARSFLSPYEFYAPAIPDMDGVGSAAGDFKRGEADAVVNRPKIVGDIVEHYLRLAPGEQGIVFANSRDHSRKIADAFNAEGISAMHVDGDTDPKDRDRFDEAFRAGDIRIGSNVSLFGEGYDVPNISYMADGAPTKSLVNVAQRWGRPLRLFPGKTRAIIADHAGNALPPELGGRGHGLPDDDREWTLTGRVKKAKGSSADADPITQCKQCFRVYPSSLSRCPGCAADSPAMPRVVRQEAGTLSKLEREELKRRAAAAKKDEERACTEYEQFVSLGRARGYDYPVHWAKRQCKMRRIAIPWGS